LRINAIEVLGAFVSASGAPQTNGPFDHCVDAVRAALEPQDPPNEPSGDRPACAREEADAEPDTALMEVDGGGHFAILLAVTTCISRTTRMIPQSAQSPSLGNVGGRAYPRWRGDAADSGTRS